MARLNELDPRNPTLGSGAVRVAAVQLFEANPATGDGIGAAGTVSKAVTVPAYGVLMDVIVHNEALWDDGTSAVLNIGIGADEDSIFDAVNLKATDLTAAQSISFGAQGGKGGVTITEGTSTHWLGIADASDITVNIKATVGAGDGSAGKTFVYVVYAVPELDVPTYAAS